MPIDPQTGHFYATYPPPDLNNLSRDFLNRAQYGTTTYTGPNQEVGGVQYQTGQQVPYFKEQRSYPGFVEGINIPAAIQMLAGIARNIDPRGAGSMIGTEVINYGQMKAATNAYNQQAANAREYNQRVLDVLNAWGGLSPRGKDGPTGVERKDDGSVQFKGNMGDEQPIIQEQTTPPNKAPFGQTSMTAPDGTPITLAANRGPAPGATLAQQLREMGQERALELYNDTIVSGAPATAKNRYKQTMEQVYPGSTTPQTAPQDPAQQPVAEPQSQITVPIEKQSPPGNPTYVAPPPNIPPMAQVNPPQINRLEVPQTQNAIIPGGGLSLPANTQGLVPSTRRRSQSMVDLRDIIPF